MSLAKALSDGDLRVLKRLGPGLPQLESLREQMLAGALSVERNRVAGRVEPPGPDDVADVPQAAERQRELRDLGDAALRAGAA